MWNTDTDKDMGRLEIDEKQVKTLLIQSMIATTALVWQYMHIDTTSADTWDRLTTMTLPEVLYTIQSSEAELQTKIQNNQGFVPTETQLRKVNVNLWSYISLDSAMYLTNNGTKHT